MRSGVVSRLIAGLVLLGSLALGVWLGLSAQWDRRAARSAHPRVDGRLTVEGLAAPVVILRDLRGVPHIRARSDADALRGLGFSHAQDRLAQMVWLLRSAQGRAAELIGPSALPSDRIARTVGIARHAERQTQQLDAATREALYQAIQFYDMALVLLYRGRFPAPLQAQYFVTVHRRPLHDSSHRRVQSGSVSAASKHSNLHLCLPR